MVPDTSLLTDLISKYILNIPHMVHIKFDTLSLTNSNLLAILLQKTLKSHFAPFWQPKFPKLQHVSKETMIVSLCTHCITNFVHTLYH